MDSKTEFPSSFDTTPAVDRSKWQIECGLLQSATRCNSLSLVLIERNKPAWLTVISQHALCSHQCILLIISPFRFGDNGTLTCFKCVLIQSRKILCREVNFISVVMLYCTKRCKMVVFKKSKYLPLMQCTMKCDRIELLPAFAGAIYKRPTAQSPHPIPMLFLGSV